MNLPSSFPHPVRRRLGGRAAAVPVLAVLALSLAPAPVRAQVDPQPEPAQDAAAEVEGGTRSDAPLVYIDCQRCDLQHLRREITFVNHVRDPNLAEVHVMVTNQGILQLGSVELGRAGAGRSDRDAQAGARSLRRADPPGGATPRLLHGDRDGDGGPGLRPLE
jgi:hypothetical protein